ncbi:hypothetical protein MTO96_009868 [Rhipicephalus appendiculatus]
MAAEQPVCYEPSRFLYPRLATGLAVNGLYPPSYADQSGYVAALGTSSAAFYPSLERWAEISGRVSLQVSTWFANARRRLKKENKMTWEPRNKNNESGDDKADGGASDTDNDCGDKVDGEAQRDIKPELQDTELDARKPVMERGDTGCLDLQSLTPHGGGHGSLPTPTYSSYSSKNISVANSSSNHSVHDTSSDDGSGPISPRIPRSSLRHHGAYHDDRSSGTSLVIVDPMEGSRPKIWSLAQTATSDSPPGMRRSPVPPLNDRYGFQQRLVSEANAGTAVATSGYYRDLHTDPSFMSTTQPLHAQLGHQSSKQSTSWINGHSPMAPSSASSAGHTDVLNLTPEGSPTPYVLSRPSMGCISPQPQQTTLSSVGRRFALTEDKESAAARHEQCLVKPEGNVYETNVHDMAVAEGANFCRRQQQAQALMTLQGSCLTEAATSAALVASRLPVHSTYMTAGDKMDKGKVGSPHLQTSGIGGANSSSCMSNSTAFKPVPKSFESCQLQE